MRFMTVPTATQAPPLSQDMQLLDELEALLNQRAATVVVTATQALRERLVMLCEKGMIAATPEEIEQAVTNYQAKHAPASVVEAKNQPPAVVAPPRPAPRVSLWSRLKTWWQTRRGRTVSAAPAPVKSKWLYEHDPLVDGWRTAYLTSTTRVNIGYPYPDNQVLTLTISNDPLRGKAVMLTVSAGLFTLSGHSEGTLYRFDDGRLQRVRWSDHSHALSMHPQDVKGFLAQLEKSTHLHLEVPFYRSSGSLNKTVSFPVASLDWAAVPKAK